MNIHPHQVKRLLLFGLGLLVAGFCALQLSAKIPEKIAIDQSSEVLNIAKTNYKGWKDCYILSNSEVEAIVIPQVSRIMQFRFKDGEAVFWENPRLSGKVPDIKSAKSDYFNVGGDKTWPAPQSEWEKNTGRGWPPPTIFDSVPVKVEVKGGELILISPVDPFYGIRFYRKVTVI